MVQGDVEQRLVKPKYLLSDHTQQLLTKLTSDLPSLGCPSLQHGLPALLSTHLEGAVAVAQK